MSINYNEETNIPIHKTHTKRTKIFYIIFAFILAVGFFISSNGIWWIGFSFHKNKMESTWTTWKVQATKESIKHISDSTKFSSSPLKFNGYLDPVSINQKTIPYQNNYHNIFDHKSHNNPGKVINNVFSYKTGNIYSLENKSIIDKNGYTTKYQLNNWSYYQNNAILNNNRFIEEDQYAIFARKAFAQNLLDIIKVVKPSWSKSAIKNSDLKIITNFNSYLDFKNPIDNSGKITVTIGYKKLNQQVACQISSPVQLQTTTTTKYNVNYWKSL